MRSCPYPSNFISKIIFAEHFIKKDLNIMTYMPIKMNINRCRFAHYRLNRHKIFVHPVQIFFFIPYITVHLFFKSFQFINIQLLFSLCNSFCYFRISTNIYFLCIVSTTGKWWVNVNKINLNTLLLQISASRNTFSTNNHIAVNVFAHGFLFFHFIQRHTTL